MTTEQLVRDQLDRATAEVRGGPDLATSIRAGRRRRRTKRLGLTVAAVAVVGLGAVGVRTLVADDKATVVRDAPVADASPARAQTPTDFVPGTGMDEALASVVATHLPSLPAPDDVYPSDSHTAGPMPDADFAAAEDWQTAYHLGDGHRFLLITALASEGPFECQGCDEEAAPGGTIVHDLSQSQEDGTWQFATWFVRDDGSVVGAFEYAAGEVDQPPAPQDRLLQDAALEALVQDPGLTFAALSAA